MPQSPNASIASRDPPASSDEPGNSPGLLEEVWVFGQELSAAAHSQVRLAALETRLAGESLVSMVAMGVVAAALGIVTWLALVGASMMALVERGLMTTSTALLLAMSANALIVLILIAAIRRKSRRLLLSATVNSLAPRPTDPTKQGLSA